MKKADKFKWNEACENALIAMKQGLATPLTLSKSKEGEPLLVYLVVSAKVIILTIV